jgi:2-polyprenyl-6-methoxyphenol hydroxylase-like FAD-dependent oxidoreductase
MNTIQTRCCIAGGGPAGIMLGYLLARSGIDVFVLEKWPDFFRDFRGDTIHPSTMEILAELGILDDFLKLPHNKTRQMVGHFGGAPVVLADFSRLKVRCPYIAFIPQWDFLNFLSGKAKAFPQFHLMMSTEATDLIGEGGRVIGVRAKNTEGEFDIRAELVVGADGRHSTIREKSQLRVEDLGAPIDVLWFRVPRARSDDDQSLAYLDYGHALVTLDRGDYWQCAYLIEKGGFDAIKAAGLDTFHDSVAQFVPFLKDAVKEVDSWDKVKLLSVAVDHVLDWSKDGLLLVGDAAHAMSPMGGVGINVALHDAVAAGNILVPAFRQGTPQLSTLKAVQRRREKPVRQMQRLQVFLQDRIFKPLLRRQEHIRTPWFITFLTSMPILRNIPARIIGMGFQPEHVKINF